MMIPLKKIWLDGKLIDWNKANIHVLTHGLHYGSSVFEGIRCYQTKRGPAVFRLDDHVKRFFYSMSCLKMPAQFSQKDITTAITRLIKANNADDSYIRPIAFYGYGSMALNPAGIPVGVAIASFRFDISKIGEHGVSAKISPFTRLHPDSVSIEAKVGGYYANSIFAAGDAMKGGFSEAILLDHKGYIAEGTADNIFMVKNKVLYTPLTGNILPGITRDSIIKIARSLGIKTVEKNIKPTEIKGADEVFLTGTAIEVWPVLKIDSHKIGNGKIGEVTALLKGEYGKVVRGEDKKYFKWLKFVK